jgi:CDP-diacylglycerol--glycerol-3-phosphate 3-phosphatidyltransferase
MKQQSKVAHRLAWIPYALVGSRVIAGPILLACAATRHLGVPFLAILIAAVVSDILDGMIARRLGTSSARLRQLDGFADLALYLQLSMGAVLLDPATFRTLTAPIAVLVAGQVVLYCSCLVRYRRPPSYHGVTAKAWGLGLTIAFITIFCAGETEAGVWIALILGYINTLDELGMTALLPAWHTDVLTLAVASRLRRVDLMP